MTDRDLFVGEPRDRTLEARRWLEAARSFSHSGDTLAAAQAFRAGGDPLRAGCAFLQARRPFEAARCFIECGERQAAISTLRQVPSGSRDTVAATLLLAPLLYEQGLCDEGLARLDALPADDLAVPQVTASRWRWRARCLERLGRAAEAAEAYREVLALEPCDAEALGALSGSGANGRSRSR
jgi:tetratricopeptide (TPR) repeat protein